MRQRKSSSVKQQHSVISHLVVLSGPGGPLGSLVTPVSGDVEGVQGPAGEQGRVMAVPSGACRRAVISGCLL